MKNNTLKYIAIIVIIVLIFIGLFFLLKYLTRTDEKDEVFLKDYDVNEYVTTYISDEKMASIYLNDYIYIMFSDIETAYNLLDEEYRNKKFGNINNFKKYVDSLNYSSYTMIKYYKIIDDGYIFFGVYDKNNNYFIFKTKGVMQYSVYLDEDTIEIW